MAVGEERRALLSQINSQLEQTAAGLIRQAFSPGVDPFGFLSRFCNRNAQLTASLTEDKTLSQPGAVEFSSALQLLSNTQKPRDGKNILSRGILCY